MACRISNAARMSGLSALSDSGFRRYYIGSIAALIAALFQLLASQALMR